MDLSIRPLSTAKNKIKQRPLMKSDTIPRHPASCLFNGSSGSGKSTLLLNLLTRPEFFGGYFDHILLFSPTGGSDDLFEHLDIPAGNIYTSMDPDDLTAIMDKQKGLVEKKGVDKAPKILVIFEDVQGNRKFMNSKPFLRSFIANRHFGMSSWLCGQSFTRTPRACRLQANNIFYFKGSGSEQKIIIDEFAPPGLTKKEFKAIVDYATRERFSFLHINMKAVQEDRFRINLDKIIQH